MEGQALISPEVLARYAADAAREVEGVRRVITGHLRRQPSVRVLVGEDGVPLQVPVVLEYGTPILPVAREVQRHVRRYLKVMADVYPAAVEVVIAQIESGQGLARAWSHSRAGRWLPLPLSATAASGGRRVVTRRSARSAGSSRPRTAGEPGGRSTSTTTGVRSASCSTGLRSCFRVLISFPPARPPRMQCSSPVPTSSIPPAPGLSSRSFWQLSARRDRGVRRRWRPLPSATTSRTTSSSASSFTARSFPTTSWPISASSRFAALAACSWRAWSWVGSSPAPRPSIPVYWLRSSAFGGPRRCRLRRGPRVGTPARGRTRPRTTYRAAERGQTMECFVSLGAQTNPPAGRSTVSRKCARVVPSSRQIGSASETLVGCGLSRAARLGCVRIPRDTNSPCALDLFGFHSLERERASGGDH